MSNIPVSRTPGGRGHYKVAPRWQAPDPTALLQSEAAYSLDHRTWHPRDLASACPHEIHAYRSVDLHRDSTRDKQPCPDKIESPSATQTPDHSRPYLPPRSHIQFPN